MRVSVCVCACMIMYGHCYQGDRHFKLAVTTALTLNGSEVNEAKSYYLLVYGNGYYEMQNSYEFFAMGHSPRYTPTRLIQGSST